MYLILHLEMCCNVLSRYVAPESLLGCLETDRPEIPEGSLLMKCDDVNLT